MDFTTATLLLVAIANICTAIIAWRTKSVVVQQAETIKTIEVATNHMKDELVAATDTAARAEGKEEGRIEEAAKHD